MKSFNSNKKSDMGYAKVIHERKEKKVLKKMDKCPRYWKQWVLRCPPEKEREKDMKKIAHVSLQSVFQVSVKKDMFQGA